ncbi:hypothetical protein AB3S75_042102 [Citrus x aurantiifolia]
MVPFVVLVFLLDAPLAADLKDSPVLNFNLHFLFLEPRKIRLENMSFQGFFPIDLSTGKC